MLLAAFAAVVVLLGPVPVVEAAPAAGPVPEHHMFAILRDYFPSSSLTIKQGERIRFVDTDPTAGPGHSFTETVPEGVTPKFDSDIVPPGTFRDVANIESLPPGTYSFNCKIHSVLKGMLTVG
jgi:plastocyanin